MVNFMGGLGGKVVVVVVVSGESVLFAAAPLDVAESFSSLLYCHVF